MGTFTNGEDTDEMPHNIAQYGISSGSTLFVKVKRHSDQKYSILFETYNLTRLDFHNGLSQVYQTRRKNPLLYKGLKFYFM